MVGRHILPYHHYNNRKWHSIFNVNRSDLHLRLIRKRLAYRRELSGTPSNTSVETPQNSSMRPPPRYIRRTRFAISFAIIVVMSFAKEYSKTTEKRRSYLDNLNSHSKEVGRNWAGTDPAKGPFYKGFATLAAGGAHGTIASSLAISFASRVV